MSVWDEWREHGPEMEPTYCEFMDETGEEVCLRRAEYFKPGGEVQFVCTEHKKLIEQKESK